MKKTLGALVLAGCVATSSMMTLASEDNIISEVYDAVYETVYELVYDTVYEDAYEVVEEDVYENVYKNVYENIPSKTITLEIDKTTAYVSNEEFQLDAAPVIVNDRTMLPIRFVAENLGATVAWDGEKSQVTITADDTDIVITIGAETALVNDGEVALDAPAFISNDRTYLPVRFVSEALGAEVVWDPDTRTVVILK